MSTPQDVNGMGGGVLVAPPADPDSGTVPPAPMGAAPSGHSPAPAPAAVRRLEQMRWLDGPAGWLEQGGAWLSASAAGPWLAGRPLGHPAHPALTDLPLGCWTSAMLVDLLGGRRGRPVARRLIAVGILSTPLVASAGIVEAGRADSPGDRRTVAAHALGNTAAWWCFVRSWRDRRRGHHLRGMLWSTLGGVATLGTGYLGGHLAFARGLGVRGGPGWATPAAGVVPIPTP